MDAFIALEEKYQQTNGFPTLLSDALQDMKDILIGYCPDSAENNKHCLKEADRFTSEHYIADLTPGAAKSLLSGNIMERLENALFSSHANNKESTLNEINTLKQELYKNKYDESEKMIGLMTLSIAAESFSFWHNVIHNENHSFHLRREHDNRELQTIELFGYSFCLNLFILAQADYDGAAKEYYEQNVTIPLSMVRILFYMLLLYTLLPVSHKHVKLQPRHHHHLQQQVLVQQHLNQAQNLPEVHQFVPHHHLHYHWLLQYQSDPQHFHLVNQVLYHQKNLVYLHQAVLLLVFLQLLE